MSCYIVMWQVAIPANREKIVGALKTFKAYCPITQTSWAVMSDKKAAEIRDQLVALLPASDRLFVVRSGTESAWKNLPPANTDWLKKNL
jgi:hypothetical protein